MWTAGLSNLAAILILQFTSASTVITAITCYSDHVLSNRSIFDLSKLQEVVVDPVADLCSKGFDHETGKVITHEAVGVTYQIICTAAQNQNEFKPSFAKIISQCISAQNVDGGEVEGTNGAIYSIYHVT